MKRRLNQLILAWAISVALIIISGCSESERPTSFKSEEFDSVDSQQLDALNKKSGNNATSQTYIVDVYLVKVKAAHSHDNSEPDADQINDFRVSVFLHGFAGTNSDGWPDCVFPGCSPPASCIQLQAGQTAFYNPYIYVVSNQMDADDTISLLLREKDVYGCIPQLPGIVSGSTSVGQLGGIGSWDKIIYENGMKIGCYAHFQIDVRSSIPE